jgi:hypothetical protein
LKDQSQRNEKPKRKQKLLSRVLVPGCASFRILSKSLAEVRGVSELVSLAKAQPVILTQSHNLLPEQLPGSTDKQLTGINRNTRFSIINLKDSYSIFEISRMKNF